MHTSPFRAEHEVIQPLFLLNRLRDQADCECLWGSRWILCYSSLGQKSSIRGFVYRRLHELPCRIHRNVQHGKSN